MRNQTTESRLAHARIGVDIGRVLMCPTDEVKGPDTSFLSASPDLAMRIPPSEGAEQILRELVHATRGHVWFVSKAGKRIRALTREWFHHNDFFTRCGVPEQHLHFCFKRHEKAGIAEELGLTHFIDDRRDVLEHLRTVVDHLYLFGIQSEAPPPWVVSVRDWADVQTRMLGPIRRTG